MIDSVIMGSMGVLGQLVIMTCPALGAVMVWALVVGLLIG